MNVYDSWRETLDPQHTFFRSSFRNSLDWKINYVTINILEIHKVYALPDLISSKYHWIFKNWLECSG